MDDELLSFYNKELTYLRRSAAAFARQNPAAATRLRINENEIEDPHVERLIQSVAFLNGRIRKKLDDDYPELTESMLNVLYPHYLNPVPSMSVVRLTPSRELTGEYRLAKGALLETEPVDGERLTFRSAYPVSLWPFEVVRAELVEGSYRAPEIPAHLNALAIVRIELRCFKDDILFSTLGPDRLRFYIQGENSVIAPLYQLLFNHVVAIAIANDPYDIKPSIIKPEHINPVGFARDEDILDYPTQSFDGYRLITEYFMFPQKYQFIEITDIADCWPGRRNKIELYFYLDRSFPDLARSVDKNTFLLGCTPIVNLFPQTAEPIVVESMNNEYRVIPDSRYPLHKEINQVKSVKAVTQDGKAIPLKPFYGISRDGSDDDDAIYWMVKRRPALEENEDQVDSGSEMFLTIADRNYLASNRSCKYTLMIETTCTNRDLPKRLPFGGGQPALRLRDGGMAKEIQCLIAPTATIRRINRDNYHWKLISHLSLNYMSLMRGQNGVAALRELLSLYEFSENKANSSVIAGIADVSYKQIASRVSSRDFSALCRGIEITLTLDESRFRDQNLYLFCTMLDRFFGLFAPMNSFTKLVVKSKQKDQVIKKWKPRASYQQLA